MKRILLILGLCAAAIFPTAVAITLQEAYQKCQNVPREELEACILETIQELQTLIISGIPEIGLGPDALSVGALHFDEVMNDNYIKADFTNGKVKGFQEMDMRKLKIDYENKMADWEALIPEMFYTGRYFLDAKFLFFPLQGNGSCWFRISDLDLSGQTNFTVKEINGQPHFQATDSSFDFSVGEIAVQLNNLFNGDPILQETGRLFVNQNKELMMEELKPSVRKSMGSIGHDILNDIMANIKLEDLAGYQYLV